MVHRLIADMVRRVPLWPTWFFFAGFAVAWGALGSTRPTYAIATSLTMAFVLGPFWIPMRAETPLIPYLPVSRREIWRATWIMSTLVPVAVTAVLKLPGTIVHIAADGVLGFSGFTLSIVMDFFYVGAGCALIAWSGLAGRVRAEVRSRTRLALGALTLIGGTFLGFAIHTLLPARWSELTAGHGLFVAVGLALTITGYHHTPPFGARPLRVRLAASPRTGSPGLNPKGLAGVPRLILHELLFCSGMGAVLLVTFLGIAVLIDSFSGSLPDTAGFLLRQRLLVFAPGSVRGVQQNAGFFGQAWWFALFMAGVSVRLPDIVRHLRALPLSATHLQTLLIGWPALIWTLVWILLAAGHLALAGPGAIATLRIPLLITMVGLSAAAVAMSLRFQSQWAKSIWAAAIVPFSRLVEVESTWWLLALAVVAFAVAITLNRGALMRADTYKRIHPFGLKPQGA